MKRTCVLMFTLALLMAASLLTGCAMPITAEATPVVTQPVEAPPTQTPLPTLEPTATLAPSPTPTATVFVTATPFVPFTVNTRVDKVNVRRNPGYLFPVITVLQENYPLLVFGQAPGGEWIFVQTLNNVSGWVYTWLVVGDEQEKANLQAALPVVQPVGVMVIEGTLTDEQGQPINGIQFAITQGEGNTAPRNDAMTDRNGHFFAYMPEDTSGEWMISYIAISCESVVNDADCNLLPQYTGKVEPDRLTITLPLTEPLAFIYK